MLSISIAFGVPNSWFDHQFESAIHFRLKTAPELRMNYRRWQSDSEAFAVEKDKRVLFVHHLDFSYTVIYQLSC